MKRIFLGLPGLVTGIAFAAADGKPAGSPANKPTEKPAEKPAEKPTKKPAAPKEPKRGIGTVAMEAVLAGKTNIEALVAVRAEFPDANTTKASINWYRNKARKDGMLCTSGPLKGKPVPNARDLAKIAKAAQEGKGPDNDNADANKPTAEADPMA